MHPSQRRYTVVDTALGPLWLVASDAGLCALRYVESQTPAAFEQEFCRDQPRTSLQRDDVGLQYLADQVREALAGRLAAQAIPLDLVGTPLQVRVWHELAKLPWGRTCTYTDLARQIGRPDAVRAVASACARNPVALIVPCHRVLRKGGGLGGYYWGLERKRRLLELEGVTVD